MSQILTEKYRPVKLSDMVFINDEYKAKFTSWVETKHIDSHLLFYGHPGTGKSSSINVLINELGLTDYIRLNISDKTSIDDMRKVIDYASVPPMNNPFKIVILEEFERASKQAQSSLKYVLEQYSNWCRFIFTTNDISKIDEAIQSRCQTFHFNSLNFNEFVTRIVTILSSEGIGFDNVDIIVKYVETYFPDLRACLNAITSHTVDNKLMALNNGELYSLDKFTTVLQSFQKMDLLSLKKLIAESIPSEEITIFYQFMYNHLDLITSNQNDWDKILIKIAEYLYRHETVAYTDINLVSCLIEIKTILQIY